METADGTRDERKRHSVVILRASRASPKDLGGRTFHNGTGPPTQGVALG